MIGLGLPGLFGHPLSPLLEPCCVAPSLAHIGYAGHDASSLVHTVRTSGSFPFECATLGRANLSVLRIGEKWHRLVRQDDRDVTEAATRGDIEARRQAEKSRPVRVLTRALSFPEVFIY